MAIQGIDAASIHRLTSGQVVTDLQNAVKELVENSLDAGATSIEVRFKAYGLASIEVIDNGSGIAPADYDSVALKHYTSKLESFDDLATVRTFGFRGEALSSLCALCESVSVTTATETEAPMGTILEFDNRGHVKSRSGKTARPRGTTVTLTKLFASLPVRRKDLEKNAKREFGKALSLLQAYALVPCTFENGGVRLTVTNQLETGGRKTQFQTSGGSLSSAITSLWGPKAMDNVVTLDVQFDVEPEKSNLKRGTGADKSTRVQVKGLISKFVQGFGRSSADRQYIYVNGRPCNLGKVLRAISETYKTFNATQVPFVIADFILPTETCDINVSPDKRTIFIHREQNLISALKDALTQHFSPSHSTFNVQSTRRDSQAAQDEDTDELDELDDDELDGDNEDDTGAPYHARSTPATSDPVTAERDVPPMASPVERADAPRALRGPMHNDKRLSTPPSLQAPTIETAVVTASDLPITTVSGLQSVAVAVVPSSSTATYSFPQTKTVSSDSTTTASSAPTKAFPPNTLDGWALRSTSSAAPRKRTRQDDDSTISPASTPFGRATTSTSFDTFRFNKRQKTASPEPEEIVDVEMTTLREEAEASAEMEIVEIDIESFDTTTPSSRAELEEDRSKSAARGPTSRRATTPRLHLAEVEPLADVEVIDLTQTIDGEEEEDAGSFPLPNAQTHLTKPGPLQVERPPDQSESDISISVSVDLDALSSLWASSSIDDNNRLHDPTTEAEEAGIEADQDAAEELLSRTIHKADFARMEVLGQFNLGFIIARLRGAGESESDDLFIIDQHASDERYNFETLQETTKMETQKLLRPRRLELTSADELLAIDRIDTLRKNGFDLAIDEDAPAHERVKLTAIPISKNTTFDHTDLEELLGLLRGAAPDQMVRCSKVRTMFAMRACRKSVMIGDALNMRQMKEIVRHMGEHMGWTCPHGRPTMRHLTSLNTIPPSILSVSDIDWDDYML